MDSMCKVQFVEGALFLSVRSNFSPCDNLTLSLIVSTLEHKADSHIGLSQRTILYSANVANIAKEIHSHLIFIKISQFINNCLYI